MSTAEILAMKHAKKFGFKMYDELKVEAETLLLEKADMAPGLRWVTVFWDLHKYCVQSLESTLASQSEALEWVGRSDPESKEILLYDCNMSLSEDAAALVCSLVSGDIWMEDKITMRSLRSYLVGQNIPARRAQNIIEEVRDWWRGYVSE